MNSQREFLRTPQNAERLEQLRAMIEDLIKDEPQFTGIDAISLELLAQLVFEIEYLQTAILGEGYSVAGRKRAGKDHEKTKHPLTSVLNQSRGHLISLLKSMGMTPKSRTTMSNANGGQLGPDPLVEMLKQRAQRINL